MRTQGTALVTGGAKRIGRAICLKLAHMGYSIALHYHNSAKEAQKTRDSIREGGGTCELFSCDLTNDTEVSQFIKKVSKKFPDLNLLVNNASIFKKSNLRTVTAKDFDLDFTIHLKTPLILSRDFASVCSQGNIINIIDTHVVDDQTKHFSYLLSKKALGELTRMAAVELAPTIRVNGIAPGFILPPEGSNKRVDQIPLKKKGDVDNVTDAIEFLIRNPYVTGQVIFIDGGEHLR